MAKKTTISTIADALRCARKVKQGKSCTMQELKSTVLLLETGMKSAQRGVKEARDRTDFLERLLNRQLP
ncbi:unnamed protein product [marine sediment metagenome]|uniref:Uncharacterized protein n=1 Tax=marine sediment metagenome TaxID=412755 RepID=X1A5K7_9ZZZZ